MAQPIRMPNVDAQRAAISRLSFLVGRWLGEAHMLRAPDVWVDMIQTEQVECKLDGLLLIIEGVGRNKADGKLVLQALAIVSYDDETATYRMRAFNDGRFMETELRLAETGNELAWGFAVGNIKTSSVLRIDDKGDWTELHEIAVGSQPSRKFMEMRVRRQN